MANRKPQKRKDPPEEEEDSDPSTRRLAKLESENRRMMRMLAKLPGAPVPVAHEAADGYTRSPFVAAIARAKIP